MENDRGCSSDKQTPFYMYCPGTSGYTLVYGPCWPARDWGLFSRQFLRLSYSDTTHDTKTIKKTTRRKFVRQLIGAFRSRKRAVRKRSLPIGTASPIVFHTLQKISGRAKVCVLYIEKKKKAPSGKGKQTTHKCKQCDLPLCRVGCF
jgi:hypothetical protein